jgi:hypothetical protein
MAKSKPTKRKPKDERDGEKVPRKKTGNGLIFVLLGGAAFVLFCCVPVGIGGGWWIFGKKSDTAETGKERPLSIVGKWEVRKTHATKLSKEPKGKIVYEFRPDGTGTREFENGFLRFNYKIEGSKLTLIFTHGEFKGIVNTKLGVMDYQMTRAGDVLKLESSREDSASLECQKVN